MLDLPDACKITSRDVESFVMSIQTIKMGEKTTVVKAILRNGFEIVESSSCVDPANYNEDIGVENCMNRINDKIWFLLGFLLQSGVEGF